MDALHFAATKIQPPRPRNTRVLRAALVQGLVQALGTQRVLLLHAGAGYGKTSAITAALADPAAPIAQAWVSLDEGDDAARLYACLAAALEPLDLPWRTAPQALALLMAQGGAVGLRRAAAELVNVLADSGAARGAIVLDDLHRVDASETSDVHALLDALIERLPPGWTLVLSTRVLPPLALARWRAAGELAEFDQAALSFTADEAAELCALEGAAHRAAELQARTGGWPAGLRLCLAALRTRPGAPAASSTLMDRHLFDFLAREVLEDMPEALHLFLLRCSVLPVLTAARAAAVSGDAQANQWLDEVERRGLFATPLDAPERTLVLHDLFRQALQDRLQRQRPQEVPALLQRAAASEGDPRRRVGYLLRAQDWPAAEQALADAAPALLVQGELAEVQRLIAAFDPPWRQRSARLLRLSGMVHLLRWEWVPMAEQLQQAVKLAEAAGDRDELHLAQAYLATALYPLDRNTEAQTLIAQVRAAEPAPHAHMLALMADCSQHLRRGQMLQLPALYAQLLDLLERHGALFHWWESAPPINWTTIPGMPPLIERYIAGAWRQLGGEPLPMRADLQLLRAFLLLWAGDLPAAQAQAAATEDDARWLACAGETLVNIEIFRVIEAALRGDAPALGDRMQALFDREAGAPGERRRLWQHQMAIYGVRLHDVVDAGAPALREWASHLKENPIESDAATNARALDVRARYAAAQGRWSDAARAYTVLLPQLPVMDVMGRTVELQLRGAHALWRDGRPDEAAAALRPALQRLQQEQVFGQAALAGPQVLQALAQAAWGTRLVGGDVALLQQAAALAQRWRQAEAAAPDEGPLSSREREVLERMAAGDSNKHIARALDISPHTVKRHVANILDKLALNSRAQAAAWLHEHAGPSQGRIP